MLSAKEIKARQIQDANRVRYSIAHDKQGRRELAAKTRRRKGEAFVHVGQINKSHSNALAVCVSHWRGITMLELHDYTKLLLDFSPSGTCLFLDERHIDELIRLLEQARQIASAYR